MWDVLWDGHDISSALLDTHKACLTRAAHRIKVFAFKSVFARAWERRNMGAEAMLTPSHLPCACSALACSPTAFPGNVRCESSALLAVDADILWCRSG